MSPFLSHVDYITDSGFSFSGMVKGETWFMERPALCVFTAWLCLVSCFCSLLSIGFIALNRYIHICHHTLYNKVYTVPKTIAMCVGLWVFSIVAEMPNFFGWGDHVYDLKSRICVFDRMADFSYTVFFSVVGVACPIILISICYALIYRFVRNASMTMKLLQSGAGVIGMKVHNIEKRAKELTRTVFICFVVFVLCWTPYALVVVLDHKDVYSIEVHLYVLLLAHFNSSINWIVYGTSNKYFRRAYFRVFTLNQYAPISDADDKKVSQSIVQSTPTRPNENDSAEEKVVTKMI